MIIEYCETCEKSSFGGYYASADKDVKIFHCRICNALTYIESKGNFDFYEIDIKLRNKASKLQKELYGKKIFKTFKAVFL